MDGRITVGNSWEQKKSELQMLPLTAQPAQQSTSRIQDSTPVTISEAMSVAPEDHSYYDPVEPGIVEEWM